MRARASPLGEMGDRAVARARSRARARASAREVDARVPKSKREAFEQAREAIERALEQGAKKAEKRRRKAQGKVGRRAVRVAVELPVSDGSDEGTVEMARATLGALGAEATCVFGSAGAAALAKRTADVAFESVWIDDAWVASGAGAREGVIALVGVPADRVETAMKKCRTDESRPVVCVNVEWEHAGDGGLTHAMDRQRRGLDEQPMSELEEFTHSFVVVYSFLPLSIQASMFGATLEGAVFKCVRGGAPAGTPWRILVKENGEFEQVGAMQRRPEQTDLEAALYNSIAAKSPVNDAVGKTAGFFRGLFNKDSK